MALSLRAKSFKCRISLRVTPGFVVVVADVASRRSFWFSAADGSLLFPDAVVASALQMARFF